MTTQHPAILEAYRLLGLIEAGETLTEKDYESGRMHYSAVIKQAPGLSDSEAAIQVALRMQPIYPNGDSIDQAVAAERERCANLVKQYAESHISDAETRHHLMNVVALIAIRSGKEEENKTG